MMKEDLQFVLLGTGDRKYSDLFLNLAAQHPDRAGVRIAYDDDLAHRIEAGCDLFLMPSRWEPCGLNQMISLKYGTVPVVRATGGLDDTIIPWDPKTKKGNGFKFHEYSPDALWAALMEALSVYRRPSEWKMIMKNGMGEDHSWTVSAKEYLGVYEKAIGRREGPASRKGAKAR